MSNKTKNIISVIIILIFIAAFGRVYYVNKLIDDEGVDTTGILIAFESKKGRFKCRFFVNNRGYNASGEKGSFEYNYKVKIQYQDLFKIRYYKRNPDINEVIVDTSYFRLNKKVVWTE